MRGDAVRTARLLVTRTCSATSSVQPPAKTDRRRSSVRSTSASKAVAPFHASAQGLLARQGCAAATREQTKCIVQACGDLLHPQHTDADCRQLQRQRYPHPVDANVHDRASRLAPVSVNPGSAAAARSMKRRTDSHCNNALTEGAWRAAGMDSGDSCTVASPAMPSTSRLVARIETFAQSRSSVSASRALASTRCSQLSRISTGARAQVVGRSEHRAACSSRSPSVVATAWGTRVGSASGGEFDKPDPFGKCVEQLGGCRQPQAGLADPSWPCQGHEPHVRALPHLRIWLEQCADRGDLLLASDQGRGVDG